MTILELTGLKGDEALGFLAALGVLELATTGLGSRATLAWSTDASPTALVEVDALSLDEFASSLHGIACDLAADDRVAPGAPADFPMRKEGVKGSDPMKLDERQAIELMRSAQQAELEGNDGFVVWLASTVNQLATETKGTRALTALYAPTGQMTMRQIFGDALVETTRQEDELLRTLRAWRRRQGFSGANLDYRALRDAADLPSGQPENIGVPGATWLALMAHPLFRLVGNGSSGHQTLWQRLRLPAIRGMALVWPVWRTLLDREAVRCLIEHPSLRVQTANEEPFSIDARASLRGLGVDRVYAAARGQLKNAQGPLGPATAIWRS